MRKSTGFQWRERVDVDNDLDESEVDDGDMMVIAHFTGSDHIIQYSSGGHAGHMAVAQRINGTLYILEAEVDSHLICIG